jgi:hypothetical protein
LSAEATGSPAFLSDMTDGAPTPINIPLTSVGLEIIGTERLLVRRAQLATCRARLHELLIAATILFRKVLAFVTFTMLLDPHINAFTVLHTGGTGVVASVVVVVVVVGGAVVAA